MNSQNNTPCPGHTGVCPFCKYEYGRPRSVVGMLEVDGMGDPVVDNCCAICYKNMKHDKKFDPELVDRFNK